MKDIEIRSVECRREGDSRRVSGYAVRFDEDSEDLGFIEQIKRGAITQEVIDNSDVFGLLNHDESRVLARSCNGQGSMQLELRDDGLFYSFEAPKTVWGDMLLEHLSRGEIRASSFAFTVSPEDNSEDWYNEKYIDANGQERCRVRRNILKINRLYDCSPVYQPAYSTTTCAKRKVDELNIDEQINMINNIYVGDE